MNNSKKIKVYLQYPWKFPDSPYYKYLINNPPKNIEYSNAQKQKGAITHKRFFWISNFLKRNIRRSVNILYPSLPNAHLSPKGDYDLIHCAHCLSRNKNKPWIVDVEAFWQFWVVGLKKLENKSRIERILLRDNCKKILPWANNVKEDLIKHFPSIESKIEVVYPAIPLPKIKKKSHSEINLIFVARYFGDKGGYTAVKVMDNLTKKYKNVKAIIVSETPKEILEKYSKNKKITFYGLMPQKELFEKVYSIGDIFIYPGYSDSFGFAFLEVMGYGIPIVTCDKGECRTEIVEDNVNGLIAGNLLSEEELNKLRKDENFETNEYLTKEMTFCTEILINNKKLRNELGKNGIKMIREGKFSLKERDKKMKKIYFNTLN